MLRVKRKFLDKVVNDNSIQNNIIKFNSDKGLIAPYHPIYFGTQRYSFILGGRSSTKTNQTAFMLVKASYDTRICDTKIICLREFATTIEESSYSVVKEQITREGWEKDFKIRKSYIMNKSTRVKFIFKGCQDVEGIKGLSRISYLWIDEAQSVDYNSFIVITDTARFETLDFSAKIYFTYNPLLVIDDIKRFKEEQEDYKELYITIFMLEKDYPDYVNKSMLAQAYLAKKKNIDYFNWRWLGYPNPEVAEMPFANVVYKDASNDNFSSSYAWLDPSFQGGDYTALTIISGADKGGMNVLGFCFKKSWFDCLDDVIELLKIYNVQGASNFWYEDNGLKDKPQVEFYKRGVLANRHRTTEDKADKIIKLAYILPDLYFKQVDDYRNSDYNKQVSNWSRRVTRKPKAHEHDDAPDSLASLCLHQNWI